MGLFGSLYSSASGMMAASRATQVTSTNVANMSTTGYKKSDTAFAEMVTSSLFSSPLEDGAGVSTTKLLRASRQGQIQQTASVTDASITGNGFFTVKGSLDDDGFLYTRNGQFNEFTIRATEDTSPLTTENTGEETYLRNSAGFYLYGWPVDANGATVGGSDVSSLVPMEVGLFQTQILPTSQISLSVNLDASEEDINPHQLGGGGQVLPITTQDSDLNRSVTVYDSEGTPRLVDFQFRKITGPMAQFSSGQASQLDYADVLVDNASGPTPGITAGDTMTINNANGPLTVTFVNGPADTSIGEANTLQDLRTVINSYNVAGTPQFEARIDDRGQFFVQSALPTESLDISTSSATVLGGTGFNFIVDPINGNNTYGPQYDISGAGAGAYPDQDSFPAIDNITNPNTQGWWEVTVQIADPANPTGAVQVPVVTGLMNFNGNGTLNAPADAALDLGLIDFDSAIGGEETAISVDVSRFSQFAGAYNVISSTQNGAATGERTGVSIADDGLVVADFSNGNKVPMYRIALATFSNPDGLTEQSGTVFAESASSGTVSLYESGENGAGIINGSTIEGSNVDIAEEFGDLIVHQRSFGLNSRVINAVDEMTQNLVRLKQ